MRTATLYTRNTGESYQKVEFSKQGKPVVPKDYSSAFYLRVSEDGTRKWLSFSGLDEALAQRQRIFDNIGIGLRPSTGLAPAEPAPIRTSSGGKLSIVDAVDDYLTEQRKRIKGWRDGSLGGLSAGTLTVISTAMENFKSACSEFGALSMDEFKNHDRGRAMLLSFLEWLDKNTERRKGKAAYTDGKKCSYVSQFLAKHGIKMAKDKKVNWAGDPGLLEWHEVPRTKKPKVDDVVFYTPADLAAMWKAAGAIADQPQYERSHYKVEDYRDLMAVLVLTGMRDEEIQHLEWSDVIWANGDGLPKFKVRDKITKFDWKPKNGERTVQPVESKAVALRTRLQARQKRMGATQGLIFPTSAGTVDQNFADRIRMMQTLAVAGKGQLKGKPYSFSRPEANGQNIVHNFRRTFATVLNSCYGLSAPTVQSRIGDADLETVQRYLGKVDDPGAMRKEFEATL